MVIIQRRVVENVGAGREESYKQRNLPARRIGPGIPLQCNGDVHAFLIKRIGPNERVVIVNAGQSREEVAQRENAHKASEFAQFVAALPTKGTSQRAWESEIGRETWAEYRDALIRLGWAEWNSIKRDGTPNETKGWTLTLSVEEILARISG